MVENMTTVRPHFVVQTAVCLLFPQREVQKELRAYRRFWRAVCVCLLIDVCAAMLFWWVCQ
jgi:hypothetical protein